MTAEAIEFLADKNDKFDIMSATEEGSGVVNLTLQFYNYEVLEEFLTRINQEYVNSF